MTNPPRDELVCQFCGASNGNHVWIGGDPCFYMPIRRSEQIEEKRVAFERKLQAKDMHDGR